MTYQILGGEADYFTVDPKTGQLRAVASFAHQAGHVFGFDVKATDRAGAHDGHSAIANVFVSKSCIIIFGHNRIYLIYWAVVNFSKPPILAIYIIVCNTYTLFISASALT